MKDYSRKLIVSGFALLLFGILLALNGAVSFSYVSGGLGLLFALIGCFGANEQEDQAKKNPDDPNES
jgi:hypothetical protein